jgi:hypothetical protein
MLANIEFADARTPLFPDGLAHQALFDIERTRPTPPEDVKWVLYS